MDLTWLTGFLASIFITISIIPQAIKMWKMRRKKLEEFHVFWFTFGILGSVLFVWYGVLIGQLGLIILNVVGLVSLVLMLLVYLGVWRYDC
jgi:uncharacterized protein with PQ loop repeat